MIKHNSVQRYLSFFEYLPPKKVEMAGCARFSTHLGGEIEKKYVPLQPEQQ